MKRFGLTLVAAFCVTALTFAAGNQPTTEKWEGRINVEKLSRFLKLTDKQEQEVANTLLPRKIRRRCFTMPSMAI